MIYCVSFTTIFFLGMAIDLACGPEPDPYDYYIRFFHNDLQKDKGYFPFYFNGYTELNGYTYELEENNKAYEQNLNAAEWSKYFRGTANQKDVYYVLYLLDEGTDSTYFRGAPKTLKSLPGDLRSNSFVQALEKNKRAKAYFLLSKQTEPFVTITDLWNANQPWDRKDQHAAAMKYLAMAADNPDKFIKLRCFYQAQRLLHYGSYFQEAAEVYDRHIKPFPTRSQVKNWALGFRAGEALHMGNPVQAAHLYAKEFMVCPEKRIQACGDFMATKVTYEHAVKSTSSMAEKAEIYAIAAFHQPRVDLQWLQKAYQTDPRSPVIGVLLSREVNKLEEQYLTPRINGTAYYRDIGYWDHTKYDSVKYGLIRYIPKLKAFCDRLADGKKYPEPALGYIASAYLSWMTGDYANGLVKIDSIDNTHIRAKLYDEEQLVKLVLLSQSIKHLNDTTESKLVPLLQWLNTKVEQEIAKGYAETENWGDYGGRCYAASSRDFYKAVLAQIYLQQKDTAKAALCIFKSERTIPYYASWQEDPGLGFDMPQFWQTKLHSRHLSQILKWDADQQKKAYMNLLLAALHQRRKIKVTDYQNGTLPNGRFNSKVITEKSAMPAIYEILGTICLREHQYAKAAAAFKKISRQKLNHEVTTLVGGPSDYVNPFADQVNTHLQYQSVANNKLIYALAMAGFKKQSAGNTASAVKACYNMANGLYNTSYYGPAWFYTSYNWADSDKYRKTGFYYYSDYLRERTAERWYLRARQLSDDTEFKARCTFMAAKCRQKSIPIPPDMEEYFGDLKYGLEFKGNTHDYDKKVRNNPYFKELKKNYSTTAFYKVAVGECSYFRDFLAGSNNDHAKQKNAR